MDKQTKVKTIVINQHASINDTFLSPYVGYPATLFCYKCGKKDLLVDGCLLENIEGTFESVNGWKYTIEKIIN